MRIMRFLDRRRKTQRNIQRHTRRVTFEPLEQRVVLSVGYIPNDPLQFGPEASPSDRYNHELMQNPAAWWVSDTEANFGDRELVVAVVDNGVDYTHPDLYENIWINQDEIPDALMNPPDPEDDGLSDVDGDGLITFVDLNDPTNLAKPYVIDHNDNGYIDAQDLLYSDYANKVANTDWNNGVDDDNNAYVDDLVGWDFKSSPDDNTPWPTTSGDHHGTRIAGILGAIPDNGVGMAGIAGNVTIMPVRMLSYESSIEYAVDNGAKIIAMSRGIGGWNSGLQKALDYAYSHDVLFFNGTDNTGRDGVTEGFLDHYRLQYEQLLFPVNTDSEGAKSLSSIGSGVDLAVPA